MPPRREVTRRAFLKSATVATTTMRLGRWIADYYLAPVGEVFRTMLPLSAEFKRTILYRIADQGQMALHMGGMSGSSARARRTPEEQLVEFRVLDYLANREEVRAESMPLEGQLVSLDYRLLRAARAFLDPELQAGKIQPADAKRVLEQDVVQSPAFAEEEVERYTYRAPGQANSYYYGYTKLIALRKDAEAEMGSKFNQKKFHDFILAQGLLPPDLMRKAVMEDFVGQGAAGVQ